MGAMPTHDQELADLGPFFAVSRTADLPEWRRLRDLLQCPVLDERVAHVRTVLAVMAGVEVEPRVAASTMSLGLFARLVSPVLGAAALGVPLPRPTLDEAWWRPVERGPWPLALTGPVRDPDPAGLLTGVVRPLADALAARYSLSEQILWGNGASAVFGAVTMIASARPALGAASRGLASALLSGPLAGTGEMRGGFVRSSCCLYYRIPGGGYCADCVLAHR
jgi:hypothetical protein